MTSTTETEAIPQATTADCDACGQTGQRSAMTFDGTSWLCANELAAREAGDLQQFIDAVAACTQRQFAAEAKRKAERAEQAAEPVQETTADQDAETGPAEAPAPAEDTPEPATDAASEVNT